jgi:uncharacterized C2H2 Zn-finger protein
VEFTCNECGETFMESSNLQRHFSAKHLNTLSSCDGCMYTSNRKDNLTRHINLKHGGEGKRKAIDDVEKRVKTQDHLEPEVESEPEKLRCTLCNLSYKQKCHLTRHMKTKHGEGGKRKAIDALDARKRVKTQEHLEPEVENDEGVVKERQLMLSMRERE